MRHYRHIFRHILALLLPALAMPALAQVTTTPYSMYGYGILSDNATSMQRQMGGIGYAMNNGRQINVMNPASYSFVDSLTFLWDIGADISFINSREGSVKEHSIGGGLDYLTMQFPLSRHFGASAGLLPVTSVGYSFGNEIRHGTMENQGSGGINQLYLGFSGNVAGFALGANVSYQFGNIINDVYSEPASSGKTLFERVMEIRDWNVTVGIQYSARLSRYDRLTIGGTWQPRKTMLGRTWATTQELTATESQPDTIASVKLKNRYYQPNSIGAGINYTRNASYRLVVEADFTWQDWSKAEYPALTTTDGKVVFQGMEFNNRMRYAAGVEFVPKQRGSYGQRIIWRAGGYYTQDYLKVRGNDVTEYGVTCGMGFPTIDQKTIINLGFEWKHRKSAPVDLLTENYFNITLGLNFNEMWFWQRKIK